MLRFCAKNLQYILLMLMSFFFIHGCAKSKLPVGEDGLRGYIYKVADVGFEYDFQIADYRRGASKASVTELINEAFTLQVSNVDHERIKNADMNLLGWRKVALDIHPESGRPTSYVFKKTKVFEEDLFRSHAVLFEDKPEIRVYLKERRFSYYAN